MSEIKNVGLTWMAKCNQLTSLPFKGLMMIAKYGMVVTYIALFHIKQAISENVVNLDDLGGAFTDCVQQRLFDALKVDAVEQEFDGLHGLAVDSQM